MFSQNCVDKLKRFGSNCSRWFDVEPLRRLNGKPDKNQQNRKLRDQEWRLLPGRSSGRNFQTPRQ